VALSSNTVVVNGLCALAAAYSLEMHSPQGFGLNQERIRLDVAKKRT